MATTAHIINVKLSKLKTALRKAATAAIKAGLYPSALLTTSNPKIEKGLSAGYMTFILHLAPAMLSGINVCLWASAGCIAVCLNTSGRGGMIADDETLTAKARAVVQYARMLKTIFFHRCQTLFMALLCKDIRRGIRKAERAGYVPVFRLNGTSDVPWETIPADGAANVFEAFPMVQFYDYTKSPNRAVTGKRGGIAPNYHLTLSRSEETTEDTVRATIAMGSNVAVVFEGKNLPETWLGFPVINGDVSDLRFNDPVGVVVGLSAKGIGRSDDSGFVVSA